MEKRYIKPLKNCYDILKETKGVNYIILCADTGDEDDPGFVGGSGWNIENGEEAPDFFTMVGGLVEHYMSEQEFSYLEKLKLLNEFHSELIKNITKEEK